MKFDVYGYDLDNLMKKLYNKKVVLKNVNRKDYKTLSFEIEDKDFKKVKRYIANYKVKSTLNLYKRLPKFLLLNLGVILAVFFSSLLALLASNFVWKIEIFGLENIDKTEVMKVLKKEGVGVGKLNLKTQKQIEEILLNKYDRLAQVSVIKLGTSIVINVSEKLVYQEEKFEPITAQFCGIITEINVVTGTLNCKVGDYVNIGDVLVLPFNVNANQQKVSVKPIAEIKGEITLVKSYQQKKQETVLKQTGKKIITYDYKLFNKHIFYGKTKNSFALFETISYNENISDLIPLKRTNITYFELDYVEITHNFELEQQEIEEKLMLELEKNLPINAENILKNTRSVTIDDVLYVTSTITLQGIIND